MGVPHSPIEEDEYLGYIPKGATIVENQWAINMNDEKFQDPYEFRPEGWLQHPDQPLCAFGFGRRTCPGKEIAQNSVFIAVARILWPTTSPIVIPMEQRFPLIHWISRRH
jgi:cytochrome P450